MITDLKEQQELIDSMYLIGDEHHLDDSKTWYASKEQAEAYLSIHEEEEYRKQMIIPETDLLKRILAMAAHYPSMRIVDLGPGAGDKAKIMLDAFKEIDVQYSAIDISEIILKHTQEQLKEYDVPQQYYLGDFTKDLGTLDTIFESFAGEPPRFIYLGATYSNFDPTEILTPVHEFMGPQDQLYVSAQLRPKNIRRLINSYKNSDYKEGFTGGAKKLGFEIDQVDITFDEEYEMIEGSFKVQNVPWLVNKTKRVKIGDRIFTFKSRKPCRERFRDELINNQFGGFFLDNNKFICALLTKHGNFYH